MLLLVGDEEIEVEAWLGVFPEPDRPQWGGVLRDVPGRLVRSAQRGKDARISLLPGGQEHPIHFAATPGTEDQECVEVLFLGVGTSPPGLL
ncbi:hypothetical protein OHB06_00645 [Streptomyces sp. NBC_01604]|uniref:hypothetical protein n=1 Tax=Streptomyces sp. NBC_01604 TaxID=2975894 RepID=UPI003867D640